MLRLCREFILENFLFLFKASPRCANLALKHYLLKPVQRIPQYQLLLTGGAKLDKFCVTRRVTFSSDVLRAAQNFISTTQRIITDTVLPPAVQERNISLEFPSSVIRFLK